MIRRFLCESKNSIRDAYVWNMISSMLFGFQSVVLIIVFSRTVGITDAGMFTLAYATASLFLLIGKYGVRNYQVSDLRNEHKFGDYLCARIISVSLMIIVTLLYTTYNYFFNDYSVRKCLIVFLVCLYKVPDALEDVYFGEYQREKRLDVGAKAMTVRLSVSIISLVLMVIMTKKLVLSLLISIVCSFSCLFFIIMWTKSIFECDRGFTKSSVKAIYKNCLPLFAGVFLAQYINNAPKYAIDSHMGDRAQAYYGFIAMPVFVIGLLNNVIFNPTIHGMARLWEEEQVRKFCKRTFGQIGIAIMITVVCILGAYLVGIPILSLLYRTDLYDYKRELLILLMGGGFLAVSGIFNIVITIMRKQYALIWGYLFVALIAAFSADKVIADFGVEGAAWLYTFLMFILMVLFGMIFTFSLLQKKRRSLIPKG